jgi:hypothetical protein
MPEFFESREAAVWTLLVLAIAGWWIASRHARRSLREERQKAARLRGVLERASSLATTARAVRCETCRTDWAALHDLCDVTAVADDAHGRAR